jgi:NAD(P)-dependent dehydrogenase (short-subunit alcohol dehydrogenase family)
MMAPNGRLAGLISIVTGASQGIAEGIAKTFAREGAAVAIASTNLPEAQRVGKEIETAGGSVLVVKTDVTRADQVTTLVQAVLERWGTIDILVNGVGGFHGMAPITEITEEQWDAVINLNLKSAFLCAKAVAPVMMEKKSGRIINIASQSGIGPNPHAPSYLPYGAAKAGMIGFSKHLAKQLGQYSITVNTVSPGTTVTPRVLKVRDKESLTKIAALNPLNRLLEPEDTAEAVLFLATREARSITGINMSVNAGTLIS